MTEPAPRGGRCHWPSLGCHVWAYVAGVGPNEGDPCRCGEATWTTAGDQGCPTCDALPDEACVTPAGKPRNDHAARAR